MGLIENNLPNKIDYLSCDLDPQEKTFIALKKVFHDGVEPKLITFETDKYKEKIDYEKLAIDFLYPKNYIIAVKDVYSGLKKNKILMNNYLQFIFKDDLVKIILKIIEKKITKIYFDRGRYKYHGRIKVFADVLRKNGVIF